MGPNAEHRNASDELLDPLSRLRNVPKRLPAFAHKYPGARLLGSQCLQHTRLWSLLFSRAAWGDARTRNAAISSRAGLWLGNRSSPNRGSRHRACKRTDSFHSFVAVSAER
jgi:hypothetical protein